MMLDGAMTDNRAYYWIATLGAAVVPAPSILTPATKSKMLALTIHNIGERGERTGWLDGAPAILAARHRTSSATKQQQQGRQV